MRSEGIIGQTCNSLFCFIIHNSGNGRLRFNVHGVAGSFGSFLFLLNNGQEVVAVVK